jgi:Tfp pilus assembly protein PilO
MPPKSNKNFLLILTFAPLALAITLGFSYVYPLYEESQRQHQELEEKRTELKTLEDKMAERARLGTTKKRLEDDITSLRNAVPQEPCLDLLMLDLSKMAGNSKVQILSLEGSDEKKSDSDGSADEDSDLEEVLSFANRPKVKNKNKSETNKPQQAQTVSPLGIKQLSRRVYITGNFADLINFLKELESYQRVLSIRDLSLAQSLNQDFQSRDKSDAQEKAQHLKSNQPVMSFLLNIYYLP